MTTLTCLEIRAVIFTPVQRGGSAGRPLLTPAPGVGQGAPDCVGWGWAAGGGWLEAISTWRRRELRYDWSNPDWRLFCFSAHTSVQAPCAHSQTHALAVTWPGVHMFMTPFVRTCTRAHLSVHEVLDGVGVIRLHSHLSALSWRLRFQASTTLPASCSSDSKCLDNRLERVTRCTIEKLLGMFIDQEAHRVVGFKEGSKGLLPARKQVCLDTELLKALP